MYETCITIRAKHQTIFDIIIYVLIFYLKYFYLPIYKPVRVSIAKKTVFNMLKLFVDQLV